MSGASEITWSVYFIQAGPGGPIKIGCTYDVEKRMSQIQAWCPFTLELRAKVEGDGLLESTIHKHFIDYCIRGEWFEPHDELSALIKLINESGNVSNSIIDAYNAKADAIDAAEEKKAARVLAKNRAKYQRTPETKAAGSAKRKLSDERRRAAKGGLRKINYEQVLTQAATHRGE